MNIFEKYGAKLASIYKEKIELNHKMVRILFYILSQKEEWVTSADISNAIGGDYQTYKAARDNLIFLKLIKESNGVKHISNAKLYALNFKDSKSKLFWDFIPNEESG